MQITKIDTIKDRKLKDIDFHKIEKFSQGNPLQDVLGLEISQ